MHAHAWQLLCTPNEFNHRARCQHVISSFCLLGERWNCSGWNAGGRKRDGGRGEAGKGEEEEEEKKGKNEDARREGGAGRKEGDKEEQA